VNLSAIEASKLIEAKLLGSGTFVINSVGSPVTAETHAICFIEAEKYIPEFIESASQVWISNQKIFDCLPAEVREKRTFLIVENPYRSFVKLVEYFHPPKINNPGINSQTHIHPSAQVDSTAQVSAGCVIEAHAKIGQGVTLYPNVWVGEGASIGAYSILYGGVKIYHHSVIGDRNILHAGCVIGSDGFGFLPDKTGLVKIPQIGRAVLMDDVEVGANSTIDRGTIEDTVIGQGTKIDNLVQIGHNCKIGRNCIFCAFVGISGNTTIGDNVLLAGQVGTKGHMSIGSNTQVGARSGVSKDLPPNSQVKGYPPQPLKDYLRLKVMIQRLPDIYKRLVSVEKKLEENKS
jgi:UDP-3-O-[3-hydroxymyristoyl] glucosamine N-acyltransferase